MVKVKIALLYDENEVTVGMYSMYSSLSSHKKHDIIFSLILIFIS